MGQPYELNVYEWRQKALSIVTLVTAIVMIPLLIYVCTTPHLVPSLPMRIGFVCGTLMIVVVTVFRRLPLIFRGAVWMSAGYLAALVTMTRMGLVGSGRIFLFAMPPLALVLLGRKPGIFGAILSVALLIVYTLLTNSGHVAQWLVIHHHPTDTPFWVIQGVTLLMVFIPMMIAAERLLSLQNNTLDAALASNLKLSTETAERQKANELLQAEIAERKRLEMDVLEISERERRHVGHDLHDGVCQLLTGTLIRCRVFQNQLKNFGDEPTESFQAIREMVSETLDLAYELSRGLASTEKVQQIDFLEQLREHVQKIPERYEIDCHLEAKGSVPILDARHAPQVINIVKEAVHNAIKHANAERITVVVNCTGDELLVEVNDNGCGIPSTVEQTGSMGLRIMKYRADVIGGQLGILPAQDGGTCIRCCVPLIKGAVPA